MQVASAMERNGPEPQPDNGPFLRPWLCPGEDQTPSLMRPQPPKAWGLRVHGPSVLESKVKALKEKMTVHKQGKKPCPTSHEHATSKESRCQRVKARGVQAFSEVVPYAQNLTDGQLDNTINEEPARNVGSRPSRSPSPGLQSWNGQNPWPPKAVRTLPDQEKSPQPGPGSLQENPTHSPIAGQPQGLELWKTIHMPSLKTGRPYPLQDSLVTGGDVDNTTLASKEDLVPTTALLGALWRVGDLRTLGTGDNILSLSERVERNRLLLQEMVKISRQSPPKVGSPPWAPSRDSVAPERPAEAVDWDSDIPVQDTGQSRTCAPKPKPMLSARHEEAKHLLQCVRVKARTQPLRASHDIVPTIAQGSRDGRRSPAVDARMTSACRNSLQNGNLNDSSSGESSSGQWPKQSTPLSHVRFEDESACEAEVRYLQRLQLRQRQMLSTGLQAVGQGPLRSKPDITNYTSQDVGNDAANRPLCCLDSSNVPASPPAWDSQRKCRTCGNCLEECCPSEGKATPDTRVFRGSQIARGAEAGLPDSQSSHSPGIPFLLPPAEPGIHMESTRETHPGDTVVPCSEEGHSALDSMDTSDSCQTSQPSRADMQTRDSNLRQQQRQQGSQPQGGQKWSRKADKELPCGLQARPHLPGFADVEVGEEGKGGGGHMTQGTWFLREDVLPKTLASEPDSASLASQKQCGPELGDHQDLSGGSWDPRRTASAPVSSMKFVSLGSGQPDQVTENQHSLDTECASSLKQSHADPLASQVQQLTSPPSSRKPLCPVPHRTTARNGHHRRRHQAEPVDTPLPLSPPRTVILNLTQAQSCSPHARHSLLDLSTTSCINHIPLGMQESGVAALHKGRVERDPCGQEPEPPLDNSRSGAFQDCLGSADIAPVNSTAITLSLASDEPGAIQEPSGGMQRAESSSGGHMPPRATLRASAGPRSAPTEGKKKRTSSITSALGLKKLFSALGHTSRPQMGTSRSYSVEQLQPVAPGPASYTSTPKVKRAPSLQFLHLVSPSHQHRKAASFQNLHSLLSAKGDRSSLYLVEGPGDPSAPGRPARASPRRALSVEDVSAPSLARTVGRVVEVFPDGTSQVQLQRPPEGSFGFCVAYGNGHRDSGLYVQAMADLDTAKLYSGLLGVEDEILEVNGAKVAGLGLAHVKELLAHAESLSIRVLRQRPAPQ